jgi:hypothetical protein
MLILMREHRIPSLSTHDGIVVLVGVEPVLTVEPEEADEIDATML